MHLISGLFLWSMTILLEVFNAILLLLVDEDKRIAVRATLSFIKSKIWLLCANIKL